MNPILQTLHDEGDSQTKENIKEFLSHKDEYDDAVYEIALYMAFLDGASHGARLLRKASLDVK